MDGRPYRELKDPVAVVGAVLGAGVGALLRNQVVAVVLVQVVLFIVDPTVSAPLEDYSSSRSTASGPR